MKPGTLVFTPPQADNSNDSTGETAAIAEKIMVNGVQAPRPLESIMDGLKELADYLAEHPQDNLPIQIAQMRLQEAHIYLAVLVSQP